MHNLKLHLLYSKIFTLSLNRQISTNHCLLARRKPNRQIIDDPGLRFQKAIFENDPEYMNSLEENDEIEPEDMNFMNLDHTYDQHYKEKKKQQELIWKKIVTAKFFSPGPQPQMMTHYEKEQIRQLHKEDPVQWNVETLAESFPATPDIIRKILRAKWKPTLERQKKIIQQVQRNWELLAEGKLEADPNYIEHLKKFTNRREVLLEQENNPKFLLPEIKDEPVWNNGEMAGILIKYEKEIEQLEEEYLKQKNNKMLTDGSKSLKLLKGTEQNEKTALQSEDFSQKIVKNSKGEESSSLKNMINFYKKDLSPQELEDFVLNKAKNKKPLTKNEGTILDHKLNKNDFNLRSFKQNLKTDLSEKKINERQKISKFSPKLFQPEHSVKISYEENETINSTDDENVENTNEEEKEYGINLSRRDMNRLRRKFMYGLDEEKLIPIPDERTKLVTETEIGKLLNPKDQESSITETTKTEKMDPKTLEEKQLKDNLYFDKEELDVRNTSFWNNERSSEEKAMAETEKKPLGGKDISKVTVADVASDDSFPFKIKIPKVKKGSGLIFRVKDCYYDDDGCFLYRVPGMTK